MAGRKKGPAEELAGKEAGKAGAQPKGSGLGRTGKEAGKAAGKVAVDPERRKLAERLTERAERLRPIRLIRMLELLPDDAMVVIASLGSLDDLDRVAQEVIFDGELRDFCKDGNMREWKALNEAVGQVMPWEDPDTIGPMIRILTWRDDVYREREARIAERANGPTY